MHPGGHYVNLRNSDKSQLGSTTTNPTKKKYQKKHKKAKPTFWKKAIQNLIVYKPNSPIKKTAGPNYSVNDMVVPRKET